MTSYAKTVGIIVVIIVYNIQYGFLFDVEAMGLGHHLQPGLEPCSLGNLDYRPVRRTASIY